MQQLLEAPLRTVRQPLLFSCKHEKKSGVKLITPVFTFVSPRSVQAEDLVGEDTEVPSNSCHPDKTLPPVSRAPFISLAAASSLNSNDKSALQSRSFKTITTSHLHKHVSRDTAWETQGEIYYE